MTAKKRATSRTQPTPKKAAGYVISAPNPFYEGYFYDGKVRFIEGKARITDALARTALYRTGDSKVGVPFEDAEQLTRHFMDTVGNDDESERQFKVAPPLSDRSEEARLVAPYYDRRVDGEFIAVTPKPDAPEWALTSLAAPDESNPNLGRTRGDRLKTRAPVMDRPLAPGPKNRVLKEEPANV